jgi:F420-dependent oxidoreductase-like protein
MQVGMQGGPAQAARLAQDFESAGADIVWVGEGYGFDVPSTLGYLAAVTDRIQIGAGILNAYSRTPALLAQTAAGVDWLSGGRCVLGLGASGPQVIEGFHGVPFERPVQRIREIHEICRQVWRREPLVHEGTAFTLPLAADQGSGLGKAIKLVNHPVRDEIPIWWGSLGPAAVEATAEVSDGWLTYLLIPEKLEAVWGEALARGLAKRSPDLGPLNVQAGVKVAIGDDVDVGAIHDSLRPMLALYVGGMGARGKNFYNDLAVAYGFEAEAAEIQDLYLEGHRAEAAAAVPEAWLDAMCLAGPPGLVAERLALLDDVGVTHLAIDSMGADPVTVVDQVRSLINA